MTDDAPTHLTEGDLDATLQRLIDEADAEDPRYQAGYTDGLQAYHRALLRRRYETDTDEDADHPTTA